MSNTEVYAIFILSLQFFEIIGFVWVGMINCANLRAFNLDGCIMFAGSYFFLMYRNVGIYILEKHIADKWMHITFIVAILQTGAVMRWIINYYSHRIKSQQHKWLYPLAVQNFKIWWHEYRHKQLAA